MPLPTVPLDFTEVEVARILSRVAVDDGCWLWTGHVNKATGYGDFSFWHGKQMCARAHRAVYTVLVGPIPEGMTLDHLCMVKACVRPSHLEPVSHQENVARAFAATGPVGGAVNTGMCRKGHVFTDANTIVNSTTGRRQCRTCREAWRMAKASA